MDTEEVSVSHTEIEQEIVEQVEDLSIDEVRAQFGSLLMASLADDPNTEIEVAA